MYVLLKNPKGTCLHNGIYELHASALYGWLVYFKRIDQEYEKSKMDLEKLRLSIWKRMEDSLENVIKQVNDTTEHYGL